MTKCVRQINLSRNSFTLGLFVLFAFSPLLLAGQEMVEVPNRPLTVEDCIALALNESPDLAASRLDVAAATEESRAARARNLPEITANASAQIFTGSPTSRFSIVNAGDTGIGINPTPTPNPNRPQPNSSRNVDLGKVEVYSARFSFPLFRDGSILGINTSPIEASKLARRRNVAWTSRLRREQVISRIIDWYITTVSALNRAQYSERRTALLEKQVNITQEQQEQGLSLPIDLKLVRSQLTNARTLSRILSQQASAGRIEMARALGFESPGQLRLSSDLPEPPPVPAAEDLLGPSLADHPAVQVQKAVIDEAQADYRLEKFRLYPSVTLQGSAVHIDDFGSDGAEVYSGALSVNVPIFDFGAQKAAARAKLAQYQAERARLSSVQQDTGFQITNIYQSIYVLSQNILTLQQEVAKANRDLQVTGSQQEQGIAAPLSAIEKELHLIAKQDDLDGLQVRRLMLYSDLQKASGGSWKWFK